MAVGRARKASAIKLSEDECDFCIVSFGAARSRSLMRNGPKSFCARRRFEQLRDRHAVGVTRQTVPRQAGVIQSAHGSLFPLGSRRRGSLMPCPTPISARWHRRSPER